MKVLNKSHSVKVDIMILEVEVQLEPSNIWYF